MTFETNVRFESAPPTHTPWLTIEHDTDNEPTQLLADLTTAGWEPNPTFRPINFPGDPTKHVLYGAVGSGPFGTWTKDERAARIMAARRVLRTHGYRTVPTIRLTRADLL